MIGSQDQHRGEPIPGSVAAPGDPLRVTLKRRAEFVAASGGARAHARTMTLQIWRRPDDAEAEPRFGLTVTKRVGGAVERNRIKRRLRAALRTAGLVPQAGHDYVIVARREALTQPFPSVVTDLAKLLEQARTGRAGKSGRPGRDGRRPGFGRGSARDSRPGQTDDRRQPARPTDP